PVIRRDLHASLSGLEWTVNAFTLTFAVLLITGAALGDRFGRRRLFVIGLGIFTLASAAAALAPSIDILIAARAVQGVGGAIAALRLRDSRGPNDSLDLPGLGFASAGLLGIVWGLVRGNQVGWASPEIITTLAGGAVLLALFLRWELRAPAPMLPLRFFRNRT